MNDDELKKLWQQQPLRDPPSAAQLLSAMQNKTTLFRRCLDARDLRELWACAIVVIIFTYFYFTVYLEPISRLGDLIVIGGAIFIAWKLVHTRRSNPPAPPGATIVQALQAELNSVRAQSRLLGSIFWWYLLPLTVGEIVATWGLRVHVSSKIFSTLVFLAVNGFIYWLNQRARVSQLLPMEAQLESLIHSAETGQPIEETHVADLHPIVLSMSTADHVKPAEFNVAFWQLALYAEIGFVGMWFFSNLSRNLDRLPPIDALLHLFTWQQLIWVIPFFLGGLLLSRLLRIGTDRAVGISALGIHLLKGQKLLLWDEIKTVRPLRVLNIRSLWLIDQSGAKVIMPWTSLERHSDLKAVVERFAPANHPIREFIPLLTRI
jgi:hypothetical protein